MEQVVRPAVQAGRGDDVLPGLGDVQNGQRLRGLARSDGQRPGAPFQRGEPLFEHVARRIHDPRVDVAEFLQPEQPGGMVGVVEDVRRRLIDRARPGNWSPGSGACPACRHSVAGF